MGRSYKHATAEHNCGVRVMLPRKNLQEISLKRSEREIETLK